MRLADAVRRFVFAAPLPALVAAALLAALLKTGVWQIPNLGASRLIAQDPFANPFQADPNAHALFWSWLGPFLAWAVGATGPAAFFLLHLAFSAGFTALFLAAAFASLPEREARVALVLFSVLPVSATAYFWVGVDSLTLFLLMAAFALPASALVAFPLGLLLGMQHFEQAFFGFGALLLGLLLARWWRVPAGRTLGWTVAALAGVVAGKLALVALFRALGVEVNSGRPHWLAEHLPLLLGQFFFHPHVILFSVLGLGWLVAAKHLERGREALPFALALLATLPLLLVSGDQTRVLAVVTFPLVATFWLLDERFLAGLGDRFVAWLALAWLVVPWTWVWGGIPRWSAFPYDVAWLLERAFGWRPVTGDPGLGMF